MVTQSVSDARLEHVLDSLVERVYLGQRLRTVECAMLFVREVDVEEIEGLAVSRSLRADVTMAENCNTVGLPQSDVLKSDDDIVAEYFSADHPEHLGVDERAPGCWCFRVWVPNL